MSLEQLPEELQEIRSYLPEVVRRLEERIPYVSALVTQEYGMQLTVDNKQTNISEKQPRRGIVFTLFNGRFFQEWATDQLERNYLMGKIDEMYHLLETMDTMPERFNIDPGLQLDKHFVSEFSIDPDTVTLADMVDACKDVITTVQSMDSKITNAVVHYHDGKEHKIFVNRNKVLSSSLTLCGIQLVAVGRNKGKTRVNMLGSGGVTGFEAIRFKRSQLEEMIRDLNLMFRNESLDPGMYDVISSPEVSGILAHEAFGHGVETDMFVKKRAKAAEYMGEMVASPLVGMIDDPSLPGLNGSYFFDDEGQLSGPTQIIESGILKNGLTDLRSATVLGLSRSANGRRESFERKVYARMSNTYFEPGASTFEEMLSNLDDGLYLKRSSSGMEDPKGWGIQVTINMALKVKNGKLTDTIYAPLTMTGYVPELLQSITETGSDLGFMGAGGRCGKGHKEMVRVTAGGPHLRFKARLG